MQGVARPQAAGSERWWSSGLPINLFPVAHELHEEFPEHAEAIHVLKTKNAHFARIAEDYHALNRAIHRMETNVEPADDATIEDLKRKRLALKDEIAGFLATA